MFTERARAKVNLTLHVAGPIADGRYKGYHPLNSWVAFASIEDELSCEVADETCLTIDGPYGQGLEADETNLILRAYHAVSAQADIAPLSFHLTKNLPVASGIGGGSADAAAALRLMNNYLQKGLSWYEEIAQSLGADVPVCLYSRTSVMSGVGEQIEEKPRLGTHAAVLVNPGVAVSTKDVFMAYDATHPPKDVRGVTGADLFEITKNGSNDLAPIAQAQVPVISTCLETLSNSENCQVARMSGSGATCFGLFPDVKSAEKAAVAIQAAYPDWWVKPCWLGDEHD